MDIFKVLITLLFQTYAVVTSAPEFCDKLPKTTSEDREWDTVQKGRSKVIQISL